MQAKVPDRTEVSDVLRNVRIVVRTVLRSLFWQKSKLLRHNCRSKLLFSGIPNLCELCMRRFLLCRYSSEVPDYRILKRLFHTSTLKDRVCCRESDHTNTHRVFSISSSFSQLPSNSGKGSISKLSNIVLYGFISYHF